MGAGPPAEFRQIRINSKMPDPERPRTRTVTAAVVESCHELLKWLIPRLDDFPRSRRFTLGAQLEQGVLNLLRLLVEAAYSRDKVPLLQRANRDLEVLRHLWRAAHELQVVGTRQYEYGAQRRGAWCAGVHELASSRVREEWANSLARAAGAA